VWSGLPSLSGASAGSVWRIRIAVWGRVKPWDSPEHGNEVGEPGGATRSLPGALLTTAPADHATARPDGLARSHVDGGMSGWSTAADELRWRLISAEFVAIPDIVRQRC
jgi:hypothetical protein